MSEKKMIFKRIRNSAVIKNPLLFEAVGLCPVVAIALSLRLALFLALVTAIEMAVCEVLASLMLKNVRRNQLVSACFSVACGVLADGNKKRSHFVRSMTLYGALSAHS